MTILSILDIMITTMVSLITIIGKKLNPTRTVESAWKGGLCCQITAGDFKIIVDEPVSVGGTNLGPQPTDLLLASVASCFTLAVAYSAQRRSVELRGLTVRVTGVYDGPKFRSMRVESLLDCDASQVEPIVRAAERVCYVTNTLKTNAEITFEGAVVERQGN